MSDIMSLFQINNPLMFEDVKDTFNPFKGIYPVSVLFKLDPSINEPFDFVDYDGVTYTPNTVIDKDSVTFFGKNGIRYIDVKFPDGSVVQVNIKRLDENLVKKIEAVFSLFNQYV